MTTNGTSGRGAWGPVLAGVASAAGLVCAASTASAQEGGLQIDFPFASPILVPVPLSAGSTITVPQYPRPEGFIGSRVFNITVMASSAGSQSVLVARPEGAGPASYTGIELRQIVSIEPPGYDAAAAALESGLDRPLHIELVSLAAPFGLTEGMSTRPYFPPAMATGLASWSNGPTLEHFNGVAETEIPLLVTTQVTLFNDDGLSEVTFLGSGITLDGMVQYSFATVPTPGTGCLMALGGAWLSRRRRGG
ncbi:MAG: MYXO-CTERM sorting domain-containing protein [Phycisphaerales bacterium]